jgi:hypothetical protein
VLSMVVDQRSTDRCDEHRGEANHADRPIDPRWSSR